MANAKKAAGISDEAVRAKTGKTWAEWFAALDRAGAREMTHKEIAAHLYEQLGGSGWWSQMVAVGYEQERGLRVKHQQADGFTANVSRTIAAPLPALYRAWSDDKRRDGWLPGAVFTVRKATPNKSMRLTWGDGKTSVEVNFYAKGEAKSQVAVQHSKLAGVKEVARQKAYWAEALGRLKEVLEA